jgi:mono/diheme cytochrome c family protein
MKKPSPRPALAIAVLAAGIVALTATLVWSRGGPSSPQASEQASEHSQTVEAGGLRVTLQLDAGGVGSRDITVLIDGADGRPADVEAVQLRLSMAEMDMGVADIQAQRLGPGRFQARGALFSMVGRWDVVAVLAREAQAPLSVPFALPIAASGELAGPLNPLIADATALAAGRQLYQSNCAACHGAAGKGDGPLAAGLRPSPGDFSEHMAAGKHTDGQIYTWVRDGVPNSAMPAWGERLSEEQLWQVVSYVRTFAPPVAPSPTGAVAQATASPAVPVAPTAAPVAEPLPPLIFTRAGNLWRSDGSASAPQPLTELPAGSYAQYPALSPAGDRIAFVITSQGPIGEEEWPQLNPDTRLAMMQRDGSGLQVLWDPDRGVLGQPAWAPDGQSIHVAFSDVLSPPGAPVPDRLFQIVRVDPATSERALALENAYDLSFSADGAMMAFLRWDEHLARFKLSVAAVDGSGERDLISGRGFLTITSPRFSPDGQRLIFVSPGGPPTDEQGYPRTHGDQSPLDRLLGLFEPPAAEAHGASADLWIVGLDGTGLRRLTTLREDSPMGVFSPDGRQVVVSAAGGIYMLNADRTNLRRLDPVGDHGGLDWGQR